MNLLTVLETGKELVDGLFEALLESAHLTKVIETAQQALCLLRGYRGTCQGFADELEYPVCLVLWYGPTHGGGVKPNAQNSAYAAVFKSFVVFGTIFR